MLPWDGQAVGETAAHAWNVAAPGQWSQLNRRARIMLQRLGVPRPWLLGYVWAYQRRGVLHVHLAFAAERELDRIAVRRYVQLLKQGLAAEWCFGFVDLQPGKSRNGKGVACYLAKYVCKEGRSGRPELAETVSHADVPSRPVYISTELTKRTRATMRNLRLRRYYWRARSMQAAGRAECWYVEDLWERGFKVQAGRLVRPLRGP